VRLNRDVIIERSQVSADVKQHDSLKASIWVDINFRQGDQQKDQPQQNIFSNLDTMRALGRLHLCETVEGADSDPARWVIRGGGEGLAAFGRADTTEGYEQGWSFPRVGVARVGEQRRNAILVSPQSHDDRGCDAYPPGRVPKEAADLLCGCWVVGTFEG
jgi:hypothetical protein